MKILEYMYGRDVSISNPKYDVIVIVKGHYHNYGFRIDTSRAIIETSQQNKELVYVHNIVTSIPNMCFIEDLAAIAIKNEVYKIVNISKGNKIQINNKIYTIYSVLVAKPKSKNKK